MLNLKIPTIIGLCLLGFFTFLSVLSLELPFSYWSQAASSISSQAVTFSNLSDRSFTVSWTTPKPSQGVITVGLNQHSFPIRAVDNRDQLLGKSGTYLTHFVTVTNLDPNTPYFVKINGQGLYPVTTGPVLTNLPPTDVTYGTVFSRAGLPQAGAIIYLTFPKDVDAGPVSTLSQADGRWALNLSTLRTQSGSQYITYDPTTTPIYLTADAGVGEKAMVTILAANNQPVPPMTLGITTNYQQAPLPAPVSPLLNLPF